MTEGAVGGWRARLAGEGIGARLARGGAATFVVGAASAGLAVLAQIALARLLGVVEFGRYAYVLGWVNLFALLAVLGFDSAALRFVAHYRVTADWGALRGFVRRAALLTAAAAAVAALVLAVAGPAFRPRAEALGPVMTAGALLLPLLVALKLPAALLQGLRRVAIGGAMQGIVRPLLLLTALGALWWRGTAPDAATAMLLNVGATAVPALLLLLVLRRALPAESRTAPPVFATRLWVTTAGPLLLIAGSQALLASTDTLMLGLMRGTTEAGLYAVAAQLVTVITLGITAINGIVAPMLAELNAVGDRAGMRRLLRLSARGVLLYAVPVVLGLAVFGRRLLAVYDPAMAASWLPMMILAAGQLAIVAFGSVGFLLTMTGHERIASGTVLASALVNVALNLMLIPRWGATGAALATALATAGRSAALTVWARRRLGLTATAFGA